MRSHASKLHVARLAAPARLLALLATVLLAPGCGDDGDGGDEGPPGPLEEVAVEPFADGFTAPVLIREIPDGTGRVAVVDQVGVVHVVSRDGAVLPTPLLDVRDSLIPLNPRFDERGLLGLAFHPDFPATGRVYAYYSAPPREGAPEGWDHTSIVSEWTVSAADPGFVDPASERVILAVDQPQFNHDGGSLAFGPEDGFLYVSLGDGGGANDVGMGHPADGNGQDPTTLLGAILRIDVDGEAPYAIPPDNPLVDDEGRDEIFAYGFRNPFRMSFDQGGDRALFVGDVGQALYEEVDIVGSGGNYGWNVREGFACFDPDDPTDPPADCAEVGPDGEALIEPILTYRNASQPGGLGLAVVGGHVYRGTDIPGLAGHYVFGDYGDDPSVGRGSLFAARPPGAGELRWELRELSVANRFDGELGQFVLGFGQDESGEMYVGVSDEPGPTGQTGAVLRIVSADDAPAPMDGGTPAPDAGPDGGSAPVARQVARGADLFADECARCHGPTGMGTALAPALVGDDALPLDPPPERDVRETSFRTAADVFAFVSANMPADAPGTLATQTYVDVLAFALDANGVTLDEPLTTENASGVVVNEGGGE